MHDPFLSEEKVAALTGCESFRFPDGLSEVDAVMLLTPHASYAVFGQPDLFAHLARCRLILDATGLWKRYDFSGASEIDYRVIGEKGSLQ